MENQEYTMYEIITMSPGMAGEVLLEECEKKKPNMELINMILEHSIVDVNWQDEDGRTVLMWASMYRKNKTAKMFLERPEIDVNVQDKNGWTALMFATYDLNAPLIEKILKHNDIEVNIKNSDGNTAWDLADNVIKKLNPKLKPYI